MKDFQVIRLLDILDVNKITEARGVTPRSIFVEGKDFTNVETVIINGLPAPTFMTLSRTNLIAEVPEMLRMATLTEVTVMSQNITFTERSLVELTVGTKPKAATGILRLMQTFLRQLLRTPGSNIFHPRTGGGMLRRVGGVIDSKSAADITIAVTAAKQSIISAQAPLRNVPASERLLNAEITNLTSDANSTSVYLTVVITSHAGTRSGATMMA